MFDGNGNPTTYAGTALTFDVENRLTGIGASWAASYRADGLRAKKVNGSATTYFLYDGGLPVVEMDANGATTSYNVFAPDGLVGRHSNSAWTYYTFDQQGNVSQRMNVSQGVLSNSVYDAYGVETSTGSPTDPFGYNAQWGYNFDRETGLYACMFRYFDPGQGRWLNRDPIGYSGGVNVYGYCYQTPSMQADPTGLVAASSADALAWSELHDAFAWFGVMNLHAGIVRDQYNNAVKRLPNIPGQHNPLRDALADKYRNQTPEPWKSALPPRTPAQSGGAAKTNPTWNKLGAGAKNVGKCFTLLGVGMDVYDISTSDDPAAAARRAAGGWGGALAGGYAGAKAGALIGSFFGPGGAAVGGLIGGIGGAIFGGMAGREVAGYYAPGTRP